MEPSESPKYDEPELVELLRNGSDIAFAHLYVEYSGALFALIVGIVADRDDAADILQDAFVNIYGKIGTYDATKARLYTWMAAIVRNLSVDRLRSRGHRNGQKNVDISNASNVMSLHGPQDPGVMDLRGLFGKMKTTYWELIELNYYKGYTHEEIAVMLGMPLGTVKTRIRAALLQLRGMMEAGTKTSAGR